LRTECSKEPTSSFQKLHREDTSLQLKMASLEDTSLQLKMASLEDTSLQLKMASLEDTSLQLKMASKTTITGRKKILSQFLKENEVGPLSDENATHFRLIFEKHYTPDEGEEKFKKEDILRVEIVMSKWDDKCFGIYHKHLSPQTAIPTSIKYLAGSKRPVNQNIARAAREAIRPQIDAFKKENPLNVDDKCPLGNCKLGSDAKVDHEILFKELLGYWMKTLDKSGQKYLKTKYNPDIFDHEFVNPESWRTYHKDHATLRWLSKKANQTRFRGKWTKKSYKYDKGLTAEKNGL
jgi:hypothetical protein